MRFFTLLALMFLFPMALLATTEVDVVPIEDVFKSIADLVSNAKGLGVLGIVSAVIVILTQLLKTQLLGSFLDKKSPLIKHLVIVLLGQVGGVIGMIAGGMKWYEGIIAGLFTYGGAIAIYEAVKAVIKKYQKPSLM